MLLESDHDGGASGALLHGHKPFVADDCHVLVVCLILGNTGNVLTGTVTEVCNNPELLNCSRPGQTLSRLNGYTANRRIAL